MIFFGLEQFYYEVGLSCLDFVEVLKYFNVSMKFCEILTLFHSHCPFCFLFYLFYISFPFIFLETLLCTYVDMLDSFIQVSEALLIFSLPLIFNILFIRLDL